jgi:hypothetical protein
MVQRGRRTFFDQNWDYRDEGLIARTARWALCATSRLRRPNSSLTLCGVAMPVVSPSVTRLTSRSADLLTSSVTVATGTAPPKGQPNATDAVELFAGAITLPRLRLVASIASSGWFARRGFSQLRANPGTA